MHVHKSFSVILVKPVGFTAFHYTHESTVYLCSTLHVLYRNINSSQIIIIICMIICLQILKWMYKGLVITPPVKIAWIAWPGKHGKVVLPVHVNEVVTDWSYALV